MPTLEAFAPRFVDGHARANRHKPSGIASIESILKWHLVPTRGPKRLDAITNEQVQRLRLALSERAPKTVNNVLLGSVRRRIADRHVVEEGHQPMVIRGCAVLGPENGGLTGGARL